MTDKELLELTHNDCETISKLALELLRVRMIVKTQAPAYIVRGERYIADWAKAILNGEDL